MSYYLVRVGEGSKYIDIVQKGGFLAVGWNDVANLQDLGNFDDIRKALLSAYKYTPMQASTQAGQLYRFGLEMQSGDIVLSPLGEGKYLVGKVGDYYFKSETQDSCPYKHRRKVEWYEKELLKEDMSTNLAYALGATLTVFSLNKYEKELDALIAGKAFTPAEKPQRVRDLIISSLMELDGRQFEDFVKHLLDIVGFSAETTQYVGDKGIDVNGILDAEGLADITLRVQVKRVRGSIGNKEVLALRGTLEQGEHGCLVTLSTFTAQAVEEATAASKVQIKLIDGNDLAAIVLKHYDDIDDSYKGLFGIRKKKDFDIEELFEIVDANSEPESIENADEKDRPIWNTILCAAQEEGFERAFINQKAWWAVRINPKYIPFIKYLAIYQVAPISKITYYGEVDKIEPYENTGKYKLYLKGDPIKLDNPVGLGENPHLKPQGPRYAKLADILSAKTLDDIFRKN